VNIPTDLASAGVARHALGCSPATRQEAVSAAQKWCVDRALRPGTVMDVMTLVDEAVAHGLRFGPRDLVMMIRWEDLDRFRIEMVWQGGSSQASVVSDSAGDSLRRSARVFDSLAERWGLGSTEGAASWQWFIVNTRLVVGPGAQAL
jgi:hypothetical protein